MSQKKFWLGLILLHLILRAASFYTPILDIDETQFAGFAHVLLDGGLPYRDSLDTKPLGIYYFYAGVFKIFGENNMLAVHAVTAMLVFFTACFLFGIFKKFSLEKEGRWAALFFIVFSTTYFPKYIATSINSVMMFFCVASVLIFPSPLAGEGGRRPGEGASQSLRMMFSGFLLGVAFLFKYQAGIQWPMVCLFLFYLFWQKEISRREFFILNLAFALGFILPFVLHSLWLFKLGVWADFLQWSVFGSGKYIAAGGEEILFWKSFVIRFGSYVLATGLLWVLAVCVMWREVCNPSPLEGEGARRAGEGTVCAPERRAATGGGPYAESRRAIFVLMFLWFVFSLVPVCLAGRFYGHYFLQVLPALCGLAALSPPLKIRGGRGALFFGVGLIIPALFFWLLRVDHRFFLKHFPDDEIYEQETIGLELKKMANPNDKIFVWGFATGIYFHAGLKPASRFLWTDLQSGRTPGPDYAKRNLEPASNLDGEALIKDGSPPRHTAGQAGAAPTQSLVWVALMHDLNENQPRFFVDTAPANIHGYGKFPVNNYPLLFEFVASHYNKVASIEGADIYELSK